MPLRDHFRPPVSTRHSWEGFHGGWPMAMVQQLADQLPEGFTAEPRVHLGQYYEIDVNTYEDDGQEAGWYEVLIYDQSRNRQLVAAVEIVSPANKDRPDHRRQFVAKCAALLQKKVCVALVDLVTTRRANLYAELMELIGRADPALGAEPPATYAVTCRTRKAGRTPLLENWLHPLAVGQPLPTLPLHLAEGIAVSLELEASYESTCRALKIA